MRANAVRSYSLDDSLKFAVIKRAKNEVPCTVRNKRIQQE